MMFWDASAIIPLHIKEPWTRIVHDITKKDSAIVAWWGSLIECYSAFARLRRDGFLKNQEEDRARNILQLLSAEWTEIQPSDDLRNMAARLLLLHPLHAADSLQLAAAMIWSGKNPRGHHFVCLDGRLREAARKEGFVLMPSDLP